MFQIEIPKRATYCVKGGEPLLQGSEYYSALRQGDKEGVYFRQDYCVACWEKASDYCHSWKSMVPIKKEADELPKRRDERALYLLKEALSQESDSAIAEAFVLVLFLVRRRRLVLRQELKREGKSAVCIYEVPETEEMLCIPKLSISPLQIENLQMELARKFK